MLSRQPSSRCSSSPVGAGMVGSVTPSLASCASTSDCCSGVSKIEASDCPPTGDSFGCARSSLTEFLHPAAHVIDRRVVVDLLSRPRIYVAEQHGDVVHDQAAASPLGRVRMSRGVWLAV